MKDMRHTALNLWKNSAISYSPMRTSHYIRGLGYENSFTDKGLVHQIQIFEVHKAHTKEKAIKRVFIGILDMVAQQYEQEEFPTCVIAASINGRITFVQRVHHQFVPATVLKAFSLGEIGDKLLFIDENNHLRLPKNIVSVVLHQIDELWSTSLE